MADNESIPEAQYHLLRAHEAIEMYNHSVKQLYKFWKGKATEYPFHQIETDWMNSVEEGAADHSTVLQEVAKDVKKRRGELESSREEGLHSWESSSVRDIQHATIQRCLRRASTALRTGRDELQ